MNKVHTIVEDGITVGRFSDILHRNKAFQEYFRGTHRTAYISMEEER